MAGHNKWSKTKHIKAVTDRKKMAERTQFVKTIAMYSRMYGEDLRFNSQLANSVALATKGRLLPPSELVFNNATRFPTLLTVLTVSE